MSSKFLGESFQYSQKQLEKIKYLAMLSDDIYWKTRDQYIHLMKSFISKIINID